MEQGEALSLLWNLFTECRQGQERVAVLTAAAGAGKTELANAFAEKAIAAGARYCGAVASRAERSLPLGVIDQMFLSADMPAAARDQAARLLADGAIAAQADALEPPGPSRVPPHLVRGLSALLLGLADAADRPLLIAVDDAQHADPASLHCLSSIIGRLRRARVMVLISARSGPQPFHPAFVADLPPQPHCRQLRLGLLSVPGVKAMLADALGGHAAEQLAAECHRISGGNRAVVRGLIGDYRRTLEGRAVTPLFVGAEASEALLSILHRCDFSMLSLARGLAVLDDDGAAAPSVAGRLVGLDSQAAARAMTALQQTGCLGPEGFFRHPTLRAAVLDGLAPGAQTVLHARAAEILHVDGAPVAVVARHLLAVDGATGAEGAWVVPVLNDAAERALDEGGVSQALSYLRLAHRVSATAGARVSGPQRAVTRAMLARAEWRVDPALAMRHSDDLIAAIRSGELTAHHALTCVSRLMWFGRADEAAEALRQIGAADRALDQAGQAELMVLREWLRWLFPAAGRDLPAAPPGEPASAPVTVSPMGQAAQLAAGLTRGAGEPPAAGHLLQADHLDERTFVLHVSQLAALLHRGRIGAADPLCDSLQQEAAAQGAITWHAVFTALRAVIAFRLGNLAAAEDHARCALAMVPARSWGVGVGLPLSILVQVATVTGRYQEALGHLCVPVPDALFETPLGLHYLQARGRFHFAREDFPAAQRDFQSIADLTAQWRVDPAALVPWRTDLALTLLRLGRGQPARELVAEQLKRLDPGQARERGITLKVLAACDDLPKRAVLLRQAVKELQGSGDRLELAYALADLSQAYHALGNLGQARAVRRRAHQTARQCGSAVLGHPLLTEAAAAADAPGEPGGDVAEPVRLDLYTGLSKAERRVAALAGEGYSNRQIASKLYITVSTVEQHLTRVYSKLKVKHRTDLAPG